MKWNWITYLLLILGSQLLHSQKKGYEIIGDEIVFTFNIHDYLEYTSDRNGSKYDFSDLEIENVRLTGDFIDWSREGWQMRRVNDSIFTLRKKLSEFDDKVGYEFKYIVNDYYWAEPNRKFNNLVDARTGDIWLHAYNLSLNTVKTDPNGNAPFSLPGHKDAREVILTGSFNKWDEKALVMDCTDQGWKLQLNLDPGRHYYKFIVDGKWLHDPNNPNKVINEFGGFNSFIDITKTVLFRLSGHEEAENVMLTGSFNDWSRNKSKMQFIDGEWQCRIEITGGKHHYKFIVDGDWITDPANPIREYDHSGNINSVIMIE